MAKTATIVIRHRVTGVAPRVSMGYDIGAEMESGVAKTATIVIRHRVTGVAPRVSMRYDIELRNGIRGLAGLRR